MRADTHSLLIYRIIYRRFPTPVIGASRRRPPRRGCIVTPLIHITKVRRLQNLPALLCILPDEMTMPKLMSKNSPHSLLLALLLLVVPVVSMAQVGINVSVNLAPPELPVYDQPPIPAPGYLWTPGYWSWNNEDYYWVPGTWVEPPQPGLLWTPGYWAFNDGVYGFRQGYWGEQVGFYGGVNYGFGYVGVGFAGGR